MVNINMRVKGTMKGAGGETELAKNTLTLDNEKRRRRDTALVLGGALLVSTFFVSNQRALFVPLDELTMPGPVAYAVSMNTGGAGSPGAAPRRYKAAGVRLPTNGSTPKAPANPVAFGVRLPQPSDALADPGFAPAGAIDTQPGIGTPFVPTNVPPGTGLPPTVSPFTGAGPAGFVAPAVPEPTTWVMMAIGIFCVGAALRRRRTSVKDQLVAGDGNGTEARQGVLAE